MYNQNIILYTIISEKYNSNMFNVYYSRQNNLDTTEIRWHTTDIPLL